MFPLHIFRPFSYSFFSKRCIKLSTVLSQREFEALNCTDGKLSQKCIDDIIMANEICESIDSDRISHFHSNQVCWLWCTRVSLIFPIKGRRKSTNRRSLECRVFHLIESKVSFPWEKLRSHFLSRRRPQRPRFVSHDQLFPHGLHRRVDDHGFACSRGISTQSQRERVLHPHEIAGAPQHMGLDGHLGQGISFAQSACLHQQSDIEFPR